MFFDHACHLLFRCYTLSNMKYEILEKKNIFRTPYFQNTFFQEHLWVASSGNIREKKMAKCNMQCNCIFSEHLFLGTPPGSCFCISMSLCHSVTQQTIMWKRGNFFCIYGSLMNVNLCHRREKHCTKNEDFH